MYTAPKSESERVATLHSLGLLDTVPQDCFDRVTGLCTELFDCSIALVSLVDADRQWFLSRAGTSVDQTPRDVSFCSVAIDQGHCLLVTDALSDERFRGNPLVTGDPKIRSYLGCPIAAPNGSLIGTVCVIDTKPNRFKAAHISQLTALVRIVQHLIQAHCDRKRGERLLEEMNERSARLEQSNLVFAQAEKVARIVSWELHLDTKLIKYSGGSVDLLERDPGCAFSLDDALNVYDPRDRPLIQQTLTKILTSKGSESSEANIITASGKKKRIMVTGQYVESKSANGPRIVGIVQDITESYRARIALQHAAEYDTLTNLFNRQAFDRQLGERLSAQKLSSVDFQIALFDLDGFKDVNDTFGHLVGDLVLNEISARLRNTVTSDTVVARWGGDEFALLMPLGLSQSRATSVVETVIGEISRDIEVGGSKVGLTATCGMVSGDHSLAARELLRRADLALYYGKSRERGHVHFYRPELELENRIKHQAIATVRSALAEDRVYPSYQPIVHLKTEELVGFETLMRLSTPQGEQLTASQVLPALMDPVLCREISERMTELFCKDYATILNAGPTTKFISLNATEADLLSRDFAGRLLATLASAGVPPNFVTLEITETMLLVNDSNTVQGVLKKLHTSGMQIALDDFGTGFSSLSHLRDFQIDKVKIDGSFIQKMNFDHQTRLIVQALIGMARNLGKEVIAEGVETPEQRDLLLQMGCHLGQGFLFGRAEPVCSMGLVQHRGRQIRQHQQ